MAMVVVARPPRQMDRRTVTEQLAMELVAAGQEMTSLGRRLEMALQAADPATLIGHIAARLQTLGAGYVDEGRGGGPGATA